MLQISETAKTKECNKIIKHIKNQALS